MLENKILADIAKQTRKQFFLGMEGSDKTLQKQSFWHNAINLSPHLKLFQVLQFYFIMAPWEEDFAWEGMTDRNWILQ